MVNSISPARTSARLLRTNNVARRIKRTERRVRQLAKAGLIRGTKIGPRRWVFAANSVEKYLREDRRGEL